MSGFFLCFFLGEVFLVMSSQKSITILGLLKDDQTIHRDFTDEILRCHQGESHAKGD